MTDNELVAFLDYTKLMYLRGKKFRDDPRAIYLAADGKYYTTYEDGDEVTREQIDRLVRHKAIVEIFKDHFVLKKYSKERK